MTALKHGILSDFEGDTARIDNEPVKMTAAAAKWCADKLKKGMSVTYEVFTGGDKDGWISKIYQDKSVDIAGDAVDQAKAKMAANGFSQPAPAKQEEKTTSTSTLGTPAGNGLPKTVEGKISVINPGTRSFNLWREDFKVTIVWSPSKDSEMAKFKQWDMVKVTYEVGTPNHLTDIIGEKKGYGGGKTYTPRNEKPMIYESAFKSCVDLVRDTDFPGMDYAARVEAVRAEADKIAKWIAKEGGV